jgi:hypothetical protein
MNDAIDLVGGGGSAQFRFLRDVSSKFGFLHRSQRRGQVKFRFAIVAD